MPGSVPSGHSLRNIASMNTPADIVWRTIRRGGSRRALGEASLVLAAVDIDHEIRRDVSDWYLVVAESDAPRAVAHLENYSLENRPQLAGPALDDPIDSGWFGVLGFLLIIWALPSLEQAQAFGWDWRGIGRLEAGSVMAGEWWRTITALTLHGDIAHLVGNSLFGALFGVLVGRYMGSGLGWLLILLSGALGNGLNAWLRPDDFRAIGASTATFAALAIGSAFVWRRGYFRGRGWRRGFAPLFAAIAMLAFTGVGDEDTDVLAHFTGFACGIGAGIVAAQLPIERLGVSGQRLCGVGALVLICVAWMAAGG